MGSQPSSPKVDIDAIISEFQDRVGPKCWYSLLSKEAAEYLGILMDDPRVKNVTVARAGNKKWPNLELTAGKIQHHRHKVCRCAR